MNAVDVTGKLERRAQRVLRSRYGYESFRSGQLDVIEAVLAGRDCVAVMPTGAGKSLCYQVPALVLAEAQEGGLDGDDEAASVAGGGAAESAAARDATADGRAAIAIAATGGAAWGVTAAWGAADARAATAAGPHRIGEFVPQQALTLVISPLVSLMSDQVSALVSNGIPAAYLNSQLTPSQQAEVLSRAAAGAYVLLYVAPERLDDPRFAAFAATAPIPLVAVDEAHCVSQWGQDFRPSYLGIGEFIASLPKRPAVAAFTATATPRVADDIARLLDLREPLRVTTGFDRPNLHFGVEQLSDKKKLARIVAYALAHPADGGIVYCATRKAVESVCESLVATGVRATRYHAGLANSERAANQRAFVNDDAPVMVATNAFGMGIDKSNVRFVIHYNMPGSLEAYYQEAGRAGRDGEPAECMLFWNDSDIATARFFIEQETENEALTPDEKHIVRASQRRRLSSMTGYCMTTECLRAYILRYFGEEGAAQCGNCSNCEGAVDAVDVTKTARSIMRCVHELRGRYGKGIVADVLTGSKNAKIREWGLDRARTYDIVEEPTGVVKEIIELLTSGEYLEISEGRYPLVGLGPRAREAATDDFRLYMKRVKKQAKAPARSGAAAPGAGRGNAKETAKKPAVLETEEQRALFERLRLLRKELADAEGVPPYIVFSDATLRGMCVDLPRTEDELLAVSGVGEVKLNRYGRLFLEEISKGQS